MNSSHLFGLLSSIEFGLLLSIWSFIVCSYHVVLNYRHQHEFKCAGRCDRMLEQRGEVRAVQKQQAHHAAAGAATASLALTNVELTLSALLFSQDGLGGNAKTLMFVNVSPSEYNADETANSLT